MPLVEFTISVPDASSTSLIFDKIQVWRASSESGTYADITADEPTYASISGSIAGPFNINGLSLSIELNGAEAVEITFSGSNPISHDDVIESINGVFTGLASEVPTDTNKVRLTSDISGTRSVIQLSGSAASILGLSTTRVSGKAPRPLLSSTTEDYLFRDFDGQPTYWYKTRFYNSSTHAVSAFSSPQKGGDGEALSSSFAVTGTVALSDLTGSPIVARRIIFVPVAPLTVNNGSGVNYGILPSVDRMEAFTDLNGVATISLIKGLRLKVFIEGTTFQREFTVPDDDFDILSVASSEPDPLSIVESPPLPIRMS